MIEIEKRLEQRFIAQENALSKAEEHAELWRKSANEWREAMNDRDRNFLSKNMGLVVGAVSILSAIIAIFGPIK